MNRKRNYYMGDDYLDIKMLPFFLFSLVLPFLFILLEQVFIAPAFLEEFSKLLLIVLVFIIFSTRRQQFFVIFLSILLFSLSENIFYLVNFTGDFEGPVIFLKRFLLVTPMHVFTGLLIFFILEFGRAISKNIFILSMCLAIGFYLAFWVHSGFNSYMSALALSF